MNGSFNSPIRGMGSRILVFTIVSLCFVALTLRAATYAPGDIIHNPGGPEPHFVISWQAEPGKVYDVLAASELGQEWNAINDEPITAASLVESFVDTSMQQSRFYTIRKRDTEPPTVESLFPRQGAIAARRQETLTVDLADETGIEPGSILFQVGDGLAITLADSRLSFADNRLTYTPAETETLGGYGETVTVQFSVADTLGHKLENFEWTFQLELESRLAEGFITVGQAPGVNLQANTESTLELVSIDGNEYRLSYTAEAHGISVGSILVSFDPATPFKIRALEIEDDAIQKIVTVVGESISLAELIEEGSIRLGADRDPESEITLASGPVIEGGLNFTEFLDGKVLFESDDILIRVITGEVALHVSAFVSGDFKKHRLVAFDFNATAGLRYEMNVEVTAKKSLATQGSLPIISPIRFIMPSPNPLIWAELAIELEAGYEAEAEFAGEVLAGIKLLKLAEVQARLRDGDWTRTLFSSPLSLQGTGPEWQVEGTARAKVFLTPKVTVYLESLAGPSVNLQPYLEAGGQFQFSPLGYEWALDGGLTSQLALDVRGWDSEWADLPSWTLIDFRRTLKSGKYPEELSPSTILSHPTSATVERGATATFSVTAAGSPAPTYQWFFNDERIPGATASSLVLHNVSSGHTGTYSAQVSNPQQTVQSQPATLAVTEGATPAGMALIPAGPFEMGDSFNEGLSEERPVHTVYVSAFYMDQTPVTKASWDEVYQWAIANGYSFDRPGSGKAANHPVHTVSWYDVVKWCNARSEKEGRVPAYYTSAAQTTVYRTGQVNVQNDWVKWNAGYRLPTEAEWEKAARGGASGQRFPWGNTITHGQANYFSDSYYSYDLSPTRGHHPTFNDGVDPYTSPVGYFEPNAYGLYDMAGNVWEWCWDSWGSWYYSSSPGTDPRGPTSGWSRVYRGGGWGSPAIHCRAAIRYGADPWQGYDFGFRSVLPPGQ